MIPNIRITAARLAALLVLAALLCAGVQAAVAEENTLTMSIGSEIDDLKTDPTISNTLLPELGGWRTYHQYTHMSPLIETDKNGDIIPWMAESYEVSDDYDTITFHLRKGVKFADGTPLNASIMKFNFDRILTYGWVDKFGFNGTQYPLNAFKYYDYSEAPEEYTFKIHFTHGWLNIATDLTSSPVFHSVISPFDVDPAWDIKGILKPEKIYNGLGAYSVDENESIPKEKLVLKKRNSWRDDLNFHKPKMDKIVLTSITDPQTAVLALENNEIDYIYRYWNPSLETLLKLKENPKIDIHTTLDAKTYYIKTAYWREPFNGTEGILLRKAICYALNREELAEGAFFGFAMPATDTMFLSPLLPNVPECCDQGYDLDLDKAKQLLTEAGWKDTDNDGVLDKNGKPLRDLNLVISTSTDLIWQKDLALLVQSQLKKIGIDVKIQALEWGEYRKTAKTGEYDMSLAYSQPRSTATSEQLIQFDRQPEINDYSNINGTLEKSANSARIAANEDERSRYICETCRILYDEAGVIPLIHPMEYAVMNKKVKSFEFNSMYIYDHLDECWIEE